MHIVIFGAGALGSYFGTRWEKAGAKVTYLVREGRYQQLREHHMHIQSVKGNDTIQEPQITTDPQQISHADILVIALKGYHLEQSQVLNLV
ncbi:2-dehydropantoate 2-reductase [Gracilibacillus halophilus YIM-C55.5]|uniref:2-dehydropantoate 2-reductase n=1 Tax=Gracilibacillus halophilus YIM-C55.5 TaxID=1308866 RepID=N4WS58_9BACI|nr:2-dehydropantoate 2-reductase N-terminal domain-containing protein [Gracilibacillus halophilus]ENH96006.1 2-dehydropantoate 2-reductase [Gracilibacillus halophilus YIM-C55.5]